MNIVLTQIYHLTILLDGILQNQYLLLPLFCGVHLNLCQTFFVRENGIDIAITNAIEAITQCLRSEDGYCTNIPEQGVSMRSLGL